MGKRDHRIHDGCTNAAVKALRNRRLLRARASTKPVTNGLQRLSYLVLDEKTMSIHKTENYHGTTIRIWVGAERDEVLDLVLATDDGSWGQHLIIKLNGVPYATLPIVGEDGLKQLIKGLQELYEYQYGEGEDD